MTKNEIINGLLEREGGYVNHSADRCGPTNWGITTKTALAHGYTDVRSLTKDQARAIYEADYWYGPRFDQVAELSPAIADELCDTGGIWARQWQVSFSNAGYQCLTYAGRFTQTSMLTVELAHAQFQR